MQIYYLGNPGFIEIRTDSPSGKLIGKINLPTTVVMDNFREIDCKLDKISGEKDIYFKFNDIDPNSVKFDWFRFEE